MPASAKLPSNFSLYDIDRRTVDLLIRNHHYSGKTPGIVRAWGLLRNGKVAGCVVYSKPASYTLCEGVCGKDLSPCVLELSRLVITCKTKNAASFLVGNSLRELGRERNSVVVSYADCNEHIGHVGYVYQATNWLYTGQGSAEPVWCHPVTGEPISYTRRHIDDKARKYGLEWTELVKRKAVGKHRYVFFSGDRRFRREARKVLRYTVFPYPKGITKRHSEIALKTKEL